MWTIQPLIGIEPLRLGMDRGTVAALAEMGPPEDTTLDDDGTLNEFRAIERPIALYRNDTLNAVKVDHHVPDVAYEGIDVFEGDPKAFLLALQAANGGAEAGLGFVIFQRIGVSTTGFYNDDTALFFDANFPEGPRIVEVFVPGKYDDIAAEFAPIDFTAF